MIQDIKIVKTGSLSVEAGEMYDHMSDDFKSRFKKFGDSSVVYIRHRGKNYLVDTGFAYEANLSHGNLEFNKKMLEHDLGLLHLAFGDIHGIFITHWHHDHFGNLHLFPGAKLFLYDPDKHLNIEIVAEKFGFSHLLPPEYLAGGDEFAGGSLLPTPGHTRNHCSVIVDYKGMKICIAGDAIVSQSYFDRDDAWPFNAGNLGKEQCIRAMNAIIEKADYIIPGHGHMFQNYKRNL